MSTGLGAVVDKTKLQVWLFCITFQILGVLCRVILAGVPAFSNSMARIMMSRDRWDTVHYDGIIQGRSFLIFLTCRESEWEGGTRLLAVIRFTPGQPKQEALENARTRDLLSKLHKAKNSPIPLNDFDGA